MITEAYQSQVREHARNLRIAADLFEKYSLIDGFVTLFEFSIRLRPDQFDRLFQGRMIEKRQSVGGRFYDAHGQLDGVDVVCMNYEPFDGSAHTAVLCVCGEMMNACPG
jgi:hypothetical protein